MQLSFFFVSCEKNFFEKIFAFLGESFFDFLYLYK